MIRFGIIGMGIRGRLFSSVIKQNDWAELVAVCDVSAKSLSNSEFQRLNIYTNAEEMIEKEQIDAVIISTPDFLHKNAVMAAAAKKLDMMIEKPFSTDIDECFEMAQVIKKSGAKCMVAFENRWNPVFIQAKALASTEEFGSIITINAALNDTLEVPTKMISWADKSTPAWFLFPHIIDLASWIIGSEVSSVFAQGVKKKLVNMGIDTFDAISSVVTYENGCTATFNSNWIQPESSPNIAEMKFDVIGSKGAVFINMNNQMLTYIGERLKYPRVLATPINGRLSGAPVHMLEYFIECLRKDEQPNVGLEYGVKNTVIISAIHESIKTGERIYLETYKKIYER